MSSIEVVEELEKVIHMLECHIEYCETFDIDYLDSKEKLNDFMLLLNILKKEYPEYFL